MLKPVVLVVEDNPLIRLDLVDRLQRAGFATVEVSSADEAIVVLVERIDIRVVFTDIQMPGSMNGLELAHYVRERWPPTILIVTSAQQNPTESELPIDTSFIRKPHHPAEFRYLMLNVVSRLT